MNSNQIDETFSYQNCIIKKLSQNVEIAKVWDLEEDDNIKPHTFFLIKNNKEYVSAILVMYEDLHWFVLPQHRGKGYLLKALKKVILPYIFDVLEYEEQKITINKSQIGIDNYKSSINVALKSGFKKIDDINFIIKDSDIKTSYVPENILYKGLNDIEVNKIVNELTSMSKRLYQLNTKIEYAYGCNMLDYTNNTLKILSNKVDCNISVIKDIIEDYR